MHLPKGWGQWPQGCHVHYVHSADFKSSLTVLLSPKNKPSPQILGPVVTQGGPLTPQASQLHLPAST